MILISCLHYLVSAKQSLRLCAVSSEIIMWGGQDTTKNQLFFFLISGPLHYSVSVHLDVYQDSI